MAVCVCVFILKALKIYCLTSERRNDLSPYQKEGKVYTEKSILNYFICKTTLDLELNTGLQVQCIF